MFIFLQGKVIYHQTMTPPWLEAHASYINSYRLNTTEQLTFLAGPKEHRAALLKVPVIPANVLKNSTMLTVKIVVSNDVAIGKSKDSYAKYGMSDGINFVGFETPYEEKHYNKPPCFRYEGSSGATLNEPRWMFGKSSLPNDRFYPGQFVFTIRLDARESWGSCYTVHDGGYINTVSYSKRLNLSKGLILEVYKGKKEERLGIKFIEVTVVADL